MTPSKPKSFSRTASGTASWLGVSRLLLVSASLALPLALTSCGYVSEKYNEAKRRPIEYQSAEEETGLEVPPDLTKSTIQDRLSVPSLGGTSYSDYALDKQNNKGIKTGGVLETAPSVRVEHDGDKYWLVLDQTPEEVWQRIQDFWLANGFLLKEEDPRIGIMETEWAENRAELPLGTVRKFLSSVVDSLYDTGTRDKYRLRIEKGEKPGTTEVFVTHTRAEEKLVGNDGETVWELIGSDHELEIEMLRRIAVHLGVEDQRSDTLFAQSKLKAHNRAKLITDSQGRSALLLALDFSRAWRLTGLALDRVGFTVEDRDRSKGTYFVRYADPLKDQPKSKSFLSKLAFWQGAKKAEAAQYQIRVRNTEQGAAVTVFNKAGKPEVSKTARRILSLLNEQLR